MATNCTFKSHGNPVTGSAVSEVSGVISLADENFLNISNPLSPVVTPVTADKVRTKLLTPAVAATAGIAPGYYELVAATTYRKADR